MLKCSKEWARKMRIRRGTLSDLAAVLELDRQNPSAAHWSQLQYETFFASLPASALSERLLLIAEHERFETTTESASPGFEVIGFLAAQRVDAEWELQNIVVSSTSRRQGIGKSLLMELTSRARSGDGRTIFLEVRQSNQGARSFYKTLGFAEDGLRNNYYSFPVEDAVICRLGL